MARRSPMNPRYQKNTGPAGHTRRSASAARPKREAGASAPASPKKKTERPSLREAFTAQQTPEMKKWRRVWWVLIVLAFAFALIAGFVKPVQQIPAVRIAVMAAYLAALGAALYVDLGIIRKMRNKAAADAKGAKKEK